MPQRHQGEEVTDDFDGDRIGTCMCRMLGATKKRRSTSRLKLSQAPPPKVLSEVEPG